MTSLAFLKLSMDWNAEPNAPMPEVAVDYATLRLLFFLNFQAYDAREEEKGIITFHDCRIWRLGPTNDEGWYRGQCRYSRLAPAWGEFYEVIGLIPPQSRQIGV